MAFNKENKVSYYELAPSLQEMLNAKVSTALFNAHINDNKIHITPGERDYWNSVQAEAKTYTDQRLNTILGDYSSTGQDLTTAISSKMSKNEFNTFRESLARIAFSGSYADLLDKPSGIASSDHANMADTATRAINADNASHANNADWANNAGNANTVGGIRVTIGPNAPNNPQPLKELWFDSNTKYIKFYHTDGRWHTTGAALRTTDI